MSSSRAVVVIGALSLGLSNCQGRSVVPTSPTSVAPPTVSVTTRVAPLVREPVFHDLVGLVSESTSAGEIPVEGALVEILSCQASAICGSAMVSRTVTDREGSYRFSGLYSANTADSYQAINIVWVTKPGYIDPFPPRPEASEGGQFVRLIGNTRFDVHVVREEPSYEK